MTSQHHKHKVRVFPIWAGVLSLVLGFPFFALASGYGHGETHHASAKTSPHGSSSMGHNKDYSSGGSMHGGHGAKGGTHGRSHGSHQSATTFIDHILKFKDGMAITDDQVAKLQTIKTEFKKTKIQMKANIQITSVDLHDLLRDDKGSLNEVEAKLKNLYASRASMYFASVKASRDAKAVLTDEQRSRMKTVHDRMNAHGSKMESKGHSSGYSHHDKEKKS